MRSEKIIKKEDIVWFIPNSQVQNCKKTETKSMENLFFDLGSEEVERKGCFMNMTCIFLMTTVEISQPCSQWLFLHNLVNLRV